MNKQFLDIFFFIAACLTVGLWPFCNFAFLLQSLVYKSKNGVETSYEQLSLLFYVQSLQHLFLKVYLPVQPYTSCS